MSSLAEQMMGLHDSLDRAFFAHQCALLDRDFERAATTIDAYRSCLHRHAADEEAWMLPRYEALGGDATDAPLRLFLGEHARMREFVDEFVARVDALRRAPDDRKLLELFDREATYKNLALHHDLRERNMLYPFLGARLSASEQSELWSRVQWRGDV